MFKTLKNDRYETFFDSEGYETDILLVRVSDDLYRIAGAFSSHTDKSGELQTDDWLFSGTRDECTAYAEQICGERVTLLNDELNEEK